MVIECNRLHCPLLSILKVAVHTVLPRVTPESIHDLRVLVLLIPIYLAVWNLINAIMGLFLTFVIDLAFINIIKIFPSILILKSFIFWALFALVFVRRARFVVSTSPSRSCLGERIRGNCPVYAFSSCQILGRLSSSASRVSSSFRLVVGV